MSDIVLLILPGAMYFWILFIAQGPMLEVLQEQESLVLPRLLACPVTPKQYILAKLLRCFALSSLATVVLMLASALLLGIHWGNLWELVAVIAAWALSMTGLMGFLFALVRTREQSNVLVPLVLLVFAMLGGSMFPYENLPGLLQMLGQYSPNRWAVLALEGAVHSKPLLVFMRPVAALAVLGTLGCGLGCFLLERRLAGGRRK